MIDGKFAPLTTMNNEGADMDSKSHVQDSRK